MVTRQNPISDSGEKFLGTPVTLEEAMRVMTLNGAYAMGIEDQVGSIEVYKSADFIVLEDNPFEMEVHGNLHNMKVGFTILNGECTWDEFGLFEEAGIEPVWKDKPDF